MTYSMSTAAARKASKKTQHVRSAGDWITLILLVAGALLVLFPLLVLTVNAFKTSAATATTREMMKLFQNFSGKLVVVQKEMMPSMVKCFGRESGPVAL